MWDLISYTTVDMLHFISMNPKLLNILYNNNMQATTPQHV